MSEEFLRVAKKEISQDISEIGNLLKNCSDDNDLIKNALNIEKYTHKIKGLAPMMGQEEMGQIATLLDKLLKSVATGMHSAGIYQTVRRSCIFMQNALDGVATDFQSLRLEIEENHQNLLQ